MNDVLPSLEQFLFWLFALVTCGSAVLVVATQNVVRMAFWLVISLGSVAALFFLLHADFLGAAQLLIYVGGTVVVLIFGVMLTASGPYLKITTSPGEMLLGGAVGLLLLALLISSVWLTEWSSLHVAIGKSSAELDEAAAGATLAHREDVQSGRTGRTLGLGFLGLRPDRDLGAADPGRKLSPGYLLPFEIISIHLLVVLVGAAYLARAKRRSAPVEGSA